MIGSVILFLFYLFIFGCAGSSLLCGLFLCGERGPLSSCGPRASYRGGSSCCGARALGCVGFNSCGRWAQQLRFPGARAQI